MDWWGGGRVSNVIECIQGVLDAWLSLWQWVFQPAIGVLMLGAVRVCLLFRLMLIEPVQSAALYVYDVFVKL